MSEVSDQIHGKSINGSGRAAVIRSAKDLVVYQKAYALAMRVFELSQSFPAEERYALTSQIRRSARSICLNLREAWAKRRFPAHFVSKLTDCDGENSETDSSLDFARDCGSIAASMHAELTGLCDEIGRMLGAMMRKPGAFLPAYDPPTSRVREDNTPNVDLTSDF